MDMTHHWCRTVFAAVLVGGLCWPPPATAEGSRVRLTSLPPREHVEIQLDHPTATLVAEERIVPLVEGRNQIDFAWADQIGIDPQTMVFQVLHAQDGQPLTTHVLSVSSPPNENALVWEVSADRAAAARVRISYLLEGLSSHFHYRALADENEQTLRLSQYVRVENLAGEAFGPSHVHFSFADVISRPIGSDETREMLVQRYEDVPIEKTFTAHVHEFGYLDEPQKRLRVPMHYLIHNDEDHALGQRPLPFGKVRVFQHDGRGSTAFLGEDWGEHTPVTQTMRLYLGLAQDVQVKRRIMEREEQEVAGNLSHYDIVVRYEIENFRDQPTALDIVEQVKKLREEAGIHGQQEPEWEVLQGTTFDSRPDPERTDQATLVHRVELPAREGDAAEPIIHELHIRFANEWEPRIRPLPR